MLAHTARSTILIARIAAPLPLNIRAALLHSDCAPSSAHILTLHPPHTTTHTSPLSLLADCINSPSLPTTSSNHTALLPPPHPHNTPPLSSLAYDDCINFSNYWQSPSWGEAETIAMLI